MEVAVVTPLRVRMCRSNKVCHDPCSFCEDSRRHGRFAARPGGRGRGSISPSRSGPGPRQLGSVGFTLRSGALRSDPRWSFRVAMKSGVMCSRSQNDGRVAMGRP